MNVPCDGLANCPRCIPASHPMHALAERHIPSFLILTLESTS
uniref:Uncharacterized protein n=1 Tax=Anguilla anguilla TaxID=7936 RepID=A0A0E9QZM4_ANGAN